uniref:(California timema) hypothetical protein n=1 Tax=Timema californicum TaxID=61474 RepID=A0A7R9P2B5_TIMCA|nr:unnamed protein product [Timema californicum]
MLSIIDSRCHLYNLTPQTATAVKSRTHRLTPYPYGLLFLRECSVHTFPNPRLWSETHVAHWLYWAIREFSLEGVPLNQFHMRGKDICAMGKEAFLARAPPFMGDILWEHLEILQKGTYRYVGGGDMYGEDTSGEHHYILHKVKYISAATSLPGLCAVGALRLATLVSGAENDVTSPPTPSRDNMWGHRLVEQGQGAQTWVDRLSHKPFPSLLTTILSLCIRVEHQAASCSIYQPSVASCSMYQRAINRV